MSKIGELHLHSLDQFDSQNNPEEVCKKLSEMGAKGFALTQHGVLSAVEPMRDAAEKYNLKFIPGVETYFNGVTDNCHLILLAKDDAGYTAISKAVTVSNNKDGKSVMTPEILERFFAEGTLGHGHVIATSACIQGVLAMVLRYNESVRHEIDKLETKKAKYIAPDDTRITSTKEKLAELNSSIDEVTEKRDAAKKLADMKFAKREKYVSKLEGEERRVEEELLNEDKKASENAKTELEELKKQRASLIKRKSVFEKELKAYIEKAASYEKYDSEIKEKEKMLKTEGEILSELGKHIYYYRKVFGKENFFIEVQNHRIPLEKEVYPVLAEEARKYGIPIVATNDVHIVEGTEEERLRRQILRSLRFGQWVEENIGDSELYIKTDEEMVSILSEILPKDVVDEAMSNIEKIIDSCNVEFKGKNEDHYPKYRKDADANDILEEEVNKGILWRFPDGMPEGYRKRLDYELGIIKTMGYSDYHLIVKDLLEYGRLLGAVPSERLEEAPLTIDELGKWNKENNWFNGFTIGPGRGSAVGSLVCYLLGITSLDPIKYDLLFERFLNPERVSMPDIDSDIAKATRQKVIEYVTNKYGKKAVCGIMTVNAQAPRGALRIAAKYYGQKIGQDGAFLALSDKMAKAVPNEPGIAFKSVINEENGKTVSDMLSDLFNDPDSTEILRWAKIIEGSFTTYGAHAAGIVISDNEDVSDYIPLRWNDKLGEWTSQCDKEKVEENGLLKMDLLGLKTLDIITETIRNIKKNTGLVINPLELDVNDKKVYKDIFQKGNTNSVFQFESAGMKQMLKRFKPECFEDLIILVSMFRPGPLQFIDGVIDVKNGKKPEYLTPELEPILGKTYGAIVYQEQVMEIFQKLAGYTLGGADMVRRYMSKKKQDKLAHERQAFIFGDEERSIKGCVANGIDEKAADKLFDQMSDFAKYAFNKSHAAAYAFNAFITGWLKEYYPAEFIASALNWAPNEKIAGLMHEAKIFGINVEVPNINKAEDGFSVSNGSIIFGMKAVKSVGSSAEEIIRCRREGGRFTSLKDFFLRCNINKRAVENLIKAGAFDDFCDNRQAMLSVVEEYKNVIKKVHDAEKLEDETKREKKTTQAMRSLGEIVLPVTIAEDKLIRLKEEREYLGAYVTEHPLSEYPEHKEIGATPLAEISVGNYTIFGIIESMEIKKRKKDGKEMAFIKLDDGTDTIDVCFFTQQYEQMKNFLEEGNVIVIRGEAKEEETNLTDDNGNIITVTKFYPDNTSFADKKKKEFLMSVSSYAKFHLFEEEYFLNNYRQDDGHILKIYDRATGEIRTSKYYVSENVSELSNVN